MKIENNVTIFGEHDDNTLKQVENVRKHPAVVRAALLADGHLGYGFPIGGVAAYKEHVSLSGVGFDIGCGNCAVRTDAKLEDVKANIGTIMDDLTKTISFGMGRMGKEMVDDPLFDSDVWTLRGVAPWKQLARNQLGTVGGGNHFVNIMADYKGNVWIVNHFGSRGLGHKVTTWFMQQVDASEDMMSDPVVFEEASSIGADYLAAIGLAQKYAWAGRAWVCERVAQLLGAKIEHTVHNNHNFAEKELVEGESCWVVRKGSTPLHPGSYGFVGSSMGEPSYIVQHNPDSKNNVLTMFSTVHGAGRAMSRGQAKGKRDFKTGAIALNKDGTVKRPGLISDAMMQEWVSKAGVELRGGDVDEAPHAYKRLPEVLKEMGDTVKIVETLIPLGVSMAPRNIVDPYKD